MNCTNARRLLSAYIDSELSPDGMAEMRNHLFNCPDCDREYEGLKAAKSDLTLLRAEEPGEEILRFIACKPWETGMAPRKCVAGNGTITKRLIPGFAAAAVFLVSVGIGLSTPRWSGMIEQRDLAKSFKAEHARIGYGSPLSGSPDTVGMAQVVPDEPEDVKGGTDDAMVSSNGAFVTFVSHTTVE